MKRREFISFGGRGVAVHGARTAAGDTGDRYFSAISPASDVPMIAAFRERLGETGYIEDRI